MNDSPELILDGGSSIGEQLETQITRLVLSGTLRPGEQLPTVRAVAVGLAINPRIVEQAYDRLADAGMVSWDDGSGPRVVVLSNSPEDADLKRLCEDFLRQATERGHSLATVLHVIQICLEEELSS
jgi:GntR family transcriptional regulator